MSEPEDHPPVFAGLVRTTATPAGEVDPLTKRGL